MDNNLEIISCWTGELSPKMKADFMFVVNSVFGHYCSEEYFNMKYYENPYGESVIVVAYDNGSPVGADALWRNDVMGCQSYQSADTAVIESSRGKGIFTMMVIEKLSKIKDDSLIYGQMKSRRRPLPRLCSLPHGISASLETTDLRRVCIT